MNTQTIAIAGADATSVAARAHHPRLRFIGHFVEMVVVMFVGMTVLTMVLGMPHRSPIEGQALYMATTMVVPMAGWMRIRGHTRQGAAEMAAAMVLPLAVLLPAYWAGMISGDAVIDLQHVLMLPAMLGAMLVRRADYGLAGPTA